MYASSVGNEMKDVEGGMLREAMKGKWMKYSKYFMNVKIEGVAIVTCI